MFFDAIYDSWKGMQEKKYGAAFLLMERMKAKPLGIDIGCGKFHFPYPFRFVRTDIRHGDVLADARHLPFRDSQFSTLLMIDSAHLFPLDDAFRILKEGGLAFISLPRRFWKRVDVSLEEVGRFAVQTKEEEEIRVFRK